jgi:hypothetical protein
MDSTATANQNVVKIVRLMAILLLSLGSLFRFLLVLSFYVIYCHADCATPKHTETDAFNRLKSLNGNR